MHGLEDVKWLAGELSILKGATISQVSVREPEDDYDIAAVVIEVRYSPRQIVTNEKGERLIFGTYEVWQDEEGNGPGYVALVGGRES